MVHQRNSIELLLLLETAKSLGQPFIFQIVCPALVESAMTREPEFVALIMP